MHENLINKCAEHGNYVYKAGLQTIEIWNDIFIVRESPGIIGETLIIWEGYSLGWLPKTFPQ